ncbi:2OG-Fe(II) oxygenase [Thioalkalivibrio sp. ALE23]|uniref:2OG-Fe(II) oxygenase n=1 Tax=Thioalkalivibrio sp. ALE23 TaxID=1265495 RepID=UPI0009DA9B76|nr:2OG-Fe(II) oxygenase [Thioalkalivibrio sp. ALE23]
MSKGKAISLHGDQWHEWILKNLARGVNPSSMFDQMVGGVWRRDDACEALNEGLQRVESPRPWGVELPRIDHPPRVENGAGKPVDVLCEMEDPHAIVMDGVLSEEECQGLISYAYEKGLNRSGVVDRQSGERISHDSRTSSSVMFSRAETALIDRIENRLAALTNWPVERGEGLQLLQYEPGQEYRPHYDWFDLENHGARKHTRSAGQRVATTVIYLQPAPIGGATRFPKRGIEVNPKKGGAVFFANTTMRGEPDRSTMHAGTPVEEGTKIVVTYWQRERDFQRQ